MANRNNMVSSIAFTAMLLLSLCSFVCGQQDRSDIADSELVSRLADADKATQAALEIFRRGERMIPYLMKLKGRKSIYRGSCLNDYQGGVGVREPSEDTKPKDADPDNGWYVTVEVASLYLISAIHYRNLSFAAAPYLTGAKDVRNWRYNTPKRVRRAWKATERWYARLKKEGIAKLRQADEFPLKTTRVQFRNTDPTRERDISDCSQAETDGTIPGTLVAGLGGIQTESRTTSIVGQWSDNFVIFRRRKEQKGEPTPQQRAEIARNARKPTPEPIQIEPAVITNTITPRPLIPLPSQSR
jgi:hypothetical protein